MPRQSYSQPKRKRYRVNFEQLDKLNNTVVHTWLDLAGKAKDSASLKRLKAWIEANEITLTEKMVARLEKTVK